MTDSSASREPAAASAEASTIEAVVFDLDGTLVDTMSLHYEAYRSVFASFGVSLTRAQFFRSIGGKADEVIPRLIAQQRVSATVKGIHEKKKAEVRELLLHSPLVPLECAKLLPVLRGRFRLAIATSGSREGVGIVLDRLGWRDYFEAIVTGEDVGSGKPAPDAFLLAATRLNTDPRRCMAFEDTDVGIAAATAAGMLTFDVRLTVPPSVVSGA